MIRSYELELRFGDRRSYDGNGLISADAAIFVEPRSEVENWLGLAPPLLPRGQDEAKTILIHWIEDSEFQMPQSGPTVRGDGTRGETSPTMRNGPLTREILEGLMRSVEWTLSMQAHIRTQGSQHPIRTEGICLAEFADRHQMNSQDEPKHAFQSVLIVLGHEGQGSGMVPDMAFDAAWVCDAVGNADLISEIRSSHPEADLTTFSSIRYDGSEVLCGDVVDEVEIHHFGQTSGIQERLLIFPVQPWSEESGVLTSELLGRGYSVDNASLGCIRARWVQKDALW